MPWQKGQSGNPGPKLGRPKTTLEKLLGLEDAERVAKEAIARLVLVMREAEDNRVVVQAARELLDRHYGKPTEFVEAKVEHTPTSEADLVRELDRLAERVGPTGLGQEPRPS